MKIPSRNRCKIVLGVVLWLAVNVTLCKAICSSLIVGYYVKIMIVIKQLPFCMRCVVGLFFIMDKLIRMM